MIPTRRRAAAGIADQVVSSASNYLTAFLASAVLSPDDFGGFVLAYAVVTVLLAGARAVVGESLLAHLPATAPDRRTALERSALGTAAVLGALSALVCLVGAVLVPALLVFVPWVPFVLLADAARYVLLARGDTVRALVVDGVWAVVQLAALGVVWVAGSWSVGPLALAWGAGALAAAAAFALPARQWPVHPGAWVRESRYLSGWLTLTSVLGQVQVYVVLLLAGAVLSERDTAGLRAVQLLVFQPAVTLMAALLVLLTPVLARLSAAGDDAALRRARRVATIAMAGVGLVVLLAIPLRNVLLEALFPQYTGFADLVAPIALQTAIAALTVPLQAQLRGDRRGRALFGQQLVQFTTLVAAAVLGMALGGVEGLAWGLVAATALALVSMALGARRPATVTVPPAAAGVPS
ncbi:hypothetical protein [Blastococcus sp. URHD0036]|uniref:hypothetical protein n=1 Tax=Blastococcus sp. URHD0036 TaxID=1380356 RepID=UPI0004955959|nr:hypothetical protein [Blastococcus sp. URHD0036]